jgi:transposase
MQCSVDLRERVVRMVQIERTTQKEAAERFQVSVSSVKRWLKRESLIPDKAGPKQAWSIDLEALKELVTKEPDNYLDEYAKTLNSTTSTISYNLDKLGISRKKNHAIRREKRRKAKTI